MFLWLPKIRRSRRQKVASVVMSSRVGNKADEGATTVRAVTGGTVGGLTGLLVGLGAGNSGWRSVMLAVPAAALIRLFLVGLLRFALPLVVLLGAIVGLEFPKSKLGSLQRIISRDYHIVDGTDDDVHRAGVSATGEFKIGMST